jgi:spermidine synthase
MKLFAYWPVALHPEMQDALLISYGVGSTAKALTDTRSLERIDVVDVSREILEMSEVVYADPREDPLRDPRVQVHVEDGRHFLQIAARRWDLITGEPPPPLHAGVDSLYTREYFQLIHDRLAEGGINTYWLPVHLLAVSGTKAIVRAYCDVFADCTLWTGSSWSWMLAGSRDRAWGVPAHELARQWRDAQVAPELAALGFARPEQLGITFIADAAQLAELTAGTQPLTDDFPRRLGASPTLASARGELRAWMDTARTRRRFAASPFIREAWPDELRQSTLESFWVQEALNTILIDGPGLDFPRLHRALAAGPLRSLVLWDLGLIDVLPALETLPAEQAREVRYVGILGGKALAERDFDGAAELYRRARTAEPSRAAFWQLEMFALCMAGRIAEAETVAGLARRAAVGEGIGRPYWSWMAGQFGLGARGAAS